jgi:hypothetical protein
MSDPNYSTFYEQALELLQKIDHTLAQNDAIHYKDPLAHEIEDFLKDVGVHYDSRPPEPVRAIPYVVPIEGDA